MNTYARARTIEYKMTEETKPEGNNVKSKPKEDWVKLNIGGKVFMTTKTTLCRHPNSFLARMLHNDPELPSLKVESDNHQHFSTVALH